MSLKRVPVAGGMPVIVTEVGPGAMGSWTADGVMYADLRGLFRAPTDGGASVQLAMPELAAAEQAAYPEALPGGHAVLFTVLPARTFTDVSGGALRARVEALDLRTGVRKTIISAGSRARYVSTGHLVYAVGEVLHAVGFDPDRLEVSGNPTPIAEASAGEFALSDEGTLVYVPVGGPTGASLVWVDRSGREEDLGAPGRAYNYPRISPDGTRVALDVAGPPDRDIWMWDLRRKTLSRVTVDPTGNPLVAWTHDSQEVAFGSERFGATNLFRMAADGTGEAERLLDSPRVQIPLTFAPDGRLLFSYEVPGRRRDIYALWMDGTRRIAPVIQTPADDLNAEVSPDGRWIAYDSNESGQFETYVRQYPDTDRGRRWQVSADGGRQPLWSADGRELFYRDVAGNVLAVSVALAPVFAPGAVVKAIDGSGYAGSGASGSGRKYDVAKDGRFLMIKYAPEADYARRTVVVVQNWFEELRRLAPRR
jgi:serine/threonine-protein kinase